MELDSPVEIKKLELRIPWSVPGEGSPVLGIAEIELQLRSEGR